MSASNIKAYFVGNHDYWFDGLNPKGIWGGKLSADLGLDGEVDRDHFNRMAEGRHPFTEAKLKPGKDGERSANDITISAPKDVTLLYMRTGDKRILDAFSQSCDWIMGEMEKQAAVRLSGSERAKTGQADKTTGNWSWAGFIHFEARPDKQSQLPDPQLHRHHVVFNMTRDERIKALQLGQVKEDAPLYMAMFHNELARRMRGIGYGIKRAGKVGFGIEGVPRELVERFSKRRITIQKAKDAIAQAEGITDPERLRRLQAELAVLTRKHKQKDLTRTELWKFWDSQLTKADKALLESAVGKRGWNVSSHQALQYALEHHLERASVVAEKTVLATALNYGVGSMDIGSLREAYHDLGVLVKDGMVTTKAVLEQEGRIIDFAREGKGTMRPLVRPPKQDNNVTLSAEQQVLFNHIMTSTDQVNLVVADAGTGKTTTSKPIVAAIRAQTGKHVEMLAPSANASRGVLRDEGFSQADTVASFLLSAERQAAVKNGVVWVDEASLLSINDLEALCGICRKQRARLVLQGDPKQHRSVARDGNMMHVLEEYAGVKVGRLKEIWRQKNPAYKEAVALIANGDILKGHEALQRLGGINYGSSDNAVAAEFVHCRNHGLSVLAVAPTHTVGDKLTEAIRSRLKQEGKLGDDVVVPVLKPLYWTEAQKADAGHYNGSEVIQFHRNSGAYRAGERITADRWLHDAGGGRPEHFSVYSCASLAISSGDTIRITANSWDVSGQHRLDNGSTYRIAGISKAGIQLDNGWTINTPHITHGYVSTSYGAQGKTVDVCLAAMPADSLGAINAAQFYVTASRARHAFRLYTDMSKDDLKAAIKRSDTRKSATEVFKPKRRKNPHIELRKRAQEHMQRLLREQEQSAMGPIPERDKGIYHER